MESSRSTGYTNPAEADNSSEISEEPVAPAQVIALNQLNDNSEHLNFQPVLVNKNGLIFQTQQEGEHLVVLVGSGENGEDYIPQNAQLILDDPTGQGILIDQTAILQAMQSQSKPTELLTDMTVSSDDANTSSLQSVERENSNIFKLAFMAADIHSESFPPVVNNNSESGGFFTEGFDERISDSFLNSNAEPKSIVMNETAPENTAMKVGSAKTFGSASSSFHPVKSGDSSKRVSNSTKGDGNSVVGNYSESPYLNGNKNSKENIIIKVISSLKTISSNNMLKNGDSGEHKESIEENVTPEKSKLSCPFNNPEVTNNRRNSETECNVLSFNSNVSSDESCKPQSESKNLVKSNADNTEASGSSTSTLPNTTEYEEGRKEFISALNLTFVDGSEKTSMNSEGYAVAKITRTYSRRLRVRKEGSDSTKTANEAEKLQNVSDAKNPEKKSDPYDEEDLVSGVQSRVKASYESRKRKRVGSEVAKRHQSIDADNSDNNLDSTEGVEANSIDATVHWGDYLMETSFKPRQSFLDRKSPKKKKYSNMASTAAHHSKSAAVEWEKLIKSPSVKSKKPTLASTKQRKVREKVKKQFESITVAEEKCKTDKTTIVPLKKKFQFSEKLLNDPIFDSSPRLSEFRDKFLRCRSTVTDIDKVDGLQQLKIEPRYSCSYCHFVTNVMDNMTSHTIICDNKPFYRALPSSLVTDLEMKQRIRGDNSAASSGEIGRTTTSLDSFSVPEEEPGRSGSDKSSAIVGNNFCNLDVVWVQRKKADWPALIRKLSGNFAHVMYVNPLPVMPKGVKLRLNRLTAFSDREHTKKILNETRNVPHSEEVFKATYLANVYDRRKVLGNEGDPSKYFKMTREEEFETDDEDEITLEEDEDMNTSSYLEAESNYVETDSISEKRDDSINKQDIAMDIEESYTSMLEESSSISESPEKHLSGRKGNYDEITDDSEPKSGPSGISTFFAEDEEGEEDVKFDEEAISNELRDTRAVLDYILDNRCKAYLLSVINMSVESKRRELFFDQSFSAVEELREISWYGGFNCDRDMQTIVYEYCYDQFADVMPDGVDRHRYIYEVLMPEAILCALTELKDITMEDAEMAFCNQR